MPYRVRTFRPAPWLPGAHLQTVVGRFMRPHPEIAVEPWRLDTDDDDFVDLDVGPEPAGGAAGNGDRTSDGDRGGAAPVVLVLHGLEGSSRRNYVRVMFLELLTRGIQPVGLNFRSCSGEMNRAARFYHSGDTADLELALGALRERFPDRPLGAVGFSLGGNVLLKYLGEQGERGRDRLDAAAAISVPFDLSGGSRAIERGAMGRLYTRYFLRSLQRKIEAKAEVLDPLVDLAAVREARTLREYDDAFTAPLHGFRDAEDYYVRSSSRGFLPSIRIPTLLLQADDDPFLPPGSLPEEEVAANRWLLPGFTRFGGHVGFVTGTTPLHAAFWAEAEAGRFLEEALSRSG